MTPDSESTDRQVNVVCPRCQAKGKVNWDRLDRLLCCSVCESWYKLSASASLVEVRPPAQRLEVAVRTSFSEWRGHQILLPQPMLKFKTRLRNVRPREWLARLTGWQSSAMLLSSLAVALLVGYAMTQWISSVDASPLEPLPAELNDRAPLLAHAWLEGDLPQMLRLTEPGRDRELRRWLKKTPPPVAESSRRQSLVEVASVQRTANAAATVTLNIRLVDVSGASSDAVQRQIWVQRRGTWYFLPAMPRATVKR